MSEHRSELALSHEWAVLARVGGYNCPLDAKLPTRDLAMSACAKSQQL
jgi:hypothetical protein